MKPVLTPDEKLALSRSAPGSRGLPNRFYTDTDAARLERDTLFSNTWTCIGFASDLPPGHAGAVDFMGLPLMMLRDREGSLSVFHNVCRHRGHQLVAGLCRIKNTLRCPYHSWTYDLQGALVATPHFGGPGRHDHTGFDRKQHGLHRVRSRVWLDMVFVNLDGRADDFARHLSPLRQRWEALAGKNALDSVRPAGEDGALELDLDCNWKLVVENYCESYHLPWVHPGLNSYSKLEDHYSIVEADWGAGQGTWVFDFSNRNGISLPRFPAWSKENLQIAEYIALFPNVLLGLQNDHVFTIVLSPLAPDRTRESLRLYYLGSAADDSAHRRARRIVLEGWREVFLEDVAVCESMQRGRQSPAFDGGVFSPVLDTATLSFHQWAAARLAPDSQTEGKPDAQTEV